MRRRRAPERHDGHCGLAAGARAGAYEQAFRENEIDLRVLPELTADDLKELGFAAIGHRRLLLKAIADLAAGARRAAKEGVPAAVPRICHSPGRPAPADGDVLRSGRLDAAVDPF